MHCPFEQQRPNTSIASAKAFNPAQQPQQQQQQQQRPTASYGQPGGKFLFLMRV